MKKMFVFVFGVFFLLIPYLAGAVTFLAENIVVEGRGPVEINLNLSVLVAEPVSIGFQLGYDTEQLELAGIESPAGFIFDYNETETGVIVAGGGIDVDKNVLKVLTGQVPDESPADLNGDGVIGLEDVAPVFIESKNLFTLLHFNLKEEAEFGKYEITISPIVLGEEAGYQNPAVIPVLIGGAPYPKIIGEDLGTLEAGSIVFKFLKGDVNDDEFVDLSDAILATQILAGIETPYQIFLEADVNGDDEIGLQEVVYVLQKISGRR